MGIDLHKETHTAVILNCWNQELGEITIANKPSDFAKLIRKVSRYETEEKKAVYGLENAYGYGRSLAVWLIEKGCIVKDVNPALSFAQRKSVPMYQKSDGYDAEAVALVLINMLDRLPDAIPDDKYWTLSQLVNRRDNICTHLRRLKNQLHEQLCMTYPSYKEFFSDVGRPTALYFFQAYPSPEYLRGKTAEALAEELRPISHNNCSVKRAEKILRLVEADGQTIRDHQDSRDIITRSIVSDLEHYRIQLEEVEQAIESLLPHFNCTLMTIPGINTITAANMLSAIGDINCFPGADKLAKYAGVAPVNFSSAGKGRDVCPKQGNRRLQAIFYFLAIQMVQTSSKGVPRNRILREYYLRKLAEGKSKPQALICVSRRLVNIVYGMLKNHTEYRES
ncbi:MAG: IS110 family transposase [Lachnospiraceae bacterium]|nr:IS110 family transposase [Lachnospiraceae bacterium]